MVKILVSVPRGFESEVFVSIRYRDSSGKEVKMKYSNSVTANVKKGNTVTISLKYRNKKHTALFRYWTINGSIALPNRQEEGDFCFNFKATATSYNCVATLDKQHGGKTGSF
jgi:hypothetical protein